MQPEDVVRLAGANDPAEAHLWADALVEAGIPCQVVGDNLQIAFNGVPGVQAEVWVQHRDFARAEEFLHEYFAVEHDHAHAH